MHPFAIRKHHQKVSKYLQTQSYTYLLAETLAVKRKFHYPLNQILENLSIFNSKGLKVSKQKSV